MKSIMMLPLAVGLNLAVSGLAFAQTMAPTTPAMSATTPAMAPAATSPAMSASPAMTHSASPMGEVAPLTLPDQLKLTDAQRSKIRGIRTAELAEIRAVLTPEQLKKFNEGFSKKQKLIPLINSLALTDAQKTKVSASVKKANAELKLVLTADQLKQLEQLRK